MKRIVMFCCSAAVVMLLFNSCEKEEVTSVPLLTLDEISGERLWNRITVETDYKTYRHWPGHEGVQPGQSPHGIFHRVFANSMLVDSLPIQDRKAPYGTIIVKENLTIDKELDKFTAMAKVEGYDPEHNDWFYAAFDKEGKVLAEGAPTGCVSCHAGMMDNDYIIIQALDQILP